MNDKNAPPKPSEPPLVTRASPIRHARRGGTVRRKLVAAAALLLAAHVAAAQDGDGGFSFSGTHRSRYERVAPQFRSGLSDSDQALAMQTTLRFTARLPRLDVVSEIMDSRELLNDSGSFVSATGINALEPVQAYVALHARGPGHRGASTVRIGRMTFDLGKRRLLARNRYRNTVTSFAGVDWQWHDARGRSARVFYTEPLTTLPSARAALLDNEPGLDHGLRDSTLWGLFYEPVHGPHGDTLEAYALSYRLSPLDPAARSSLMSTGVRAYRAAEQGHWSYEVEGVLQRGQTGGTITGIARDDLDVHAYFLHLELGYTFDSRWAPTLTAQFDIASGDEDPLDARSERFDTLFGARRFDFGPTGIFGPFARSNLETPGVRLTFRPHPRWQAMIAYRSYRLASPRDEWVGSGFVDPTGRSGSALGRELEARFVWAAIEDRLDVETGVAKLTLGEFPATVEGAAGRGDPGYFYAALTTRF